MNPDGFDTAQSLHDLINQSVDDMVDEASKAVSTCMAFTADQLHHALTNLLPRLTLFERAVVIEARCRLDRKAQDATE